MKAIAENRSTKTSQRPPQRPEESRRPGISAAIVTAAVLTSVLGLWSLETHGRLWHTSHWRHYVYLADAFNHGQLHLFHHPSDAGDMAVVRNRVYVVFGPLPALPLMPLVARFGERTPDILVLVLTALFGVWCFHRLLRTVHGDGDRLRLTCASVTFALGTALHYGAPMGNVWLHAQISATALQCWALWMAAARRPWLAGIALGLTVLTRPTATLAAPLALWLVARPDDGRRAARNLWKPAIAIGVPLALAVGVHAAYNVARFGSPSDAGYHYILMGDAFQRLVDRYGRFSPQFLPHNLYGLLLRPPLVTGGAITPDPHGMSVLLVTPYLLLLFVPRVWTRLEGMALANAVLIAIPSLLYYNDGWVQFGQRFSLDWIALGLLAASFGAGKAPTWLFVGLTVAGVAINAWGLAWFQANFIH